MLAACRLNDAVTSDVADLGTRLIRAKREEDWETCRSIIAETRQWLATFGGVIASRMTAHFDALSDGKSVWGQLESRLVTAIRLPQREDADHTRLLAVVKRVAHSRKRKPVGTIEATWHAMTSPRVLADKPKGAAQLLDQCPRSLVAILRPPLKRTAQMVSRRRRDA